MIQQGFPDKNGISSSKFLCSSLRSASSCIVYPGAIKETMASLVQDVDPECPDEESKLREASTLRGF